MHAVTISIVIRRRSLDNRYVDQRQTIYIYSVNKRFRFAATCRRVTDSRREVEVSIIHGAGPRRAGQGRAYQRAAGRAARARVYAPTLDP